MMIRSQGLDFTYQPEFSRGLLVLDSGVHTFLFDSYNRTRVVINPSSQRATNVFDGPTVLGKSAKVGPQPGKSESSDRDASGSGQICVSAVTAAVPNSAPSHFLAGVFPKMGKMLFSDRRFYYWLIARALRSLEQLNVPEAYRDDMAADAVGQLVCRFQENPAMNERLGKVGHKFIMWFITAVKNCCQAQQRTFDRRYSKESCMVGCNAEFDEIWMTDTRWRALLDQFRLEGGLADLRSALLPMSERDRRVLLLGAEDLRGSEPIWAKLAGKLDISPKTAKAWWTIATSNLLRYGNAAEAISRHRAG